jgi:hypothetical protein
MKQTIQKVKDYFDSLYWYHNPIYLFYLTLRYDMPAFIRNLWYFRKPLYRFRWWDPHFTQEMLKYCLIDMANNLEVKGIEIEDVKMKKVEKIRRAVKLLNHFQDDDFLELAETELGAELVTNYEFVKIKDSDYYEMVDLASEEVQAINKKIFERSSQLEEEYWSELWDIIKGNQNYQEFDKDVDFYKQFNGTGMRGWWD